MALFTPSSGYVYMAAMITLAFVVIVEHALDMQLSKIVTTSFRKLDTNGDFYHTSTHHGNTFKQDAIRIVGTQINQSKVGHGDKTINSSGIKPLNVVVFRPNYRRLWKDPKRRVNMSNCIVNTNCNIRVTKDTSGADAVILQGGNPGGKLPVRHDANQIFIFTSLETPLYLNYVNLTDPFWNTFYNWSMTYRTDSDVPYMYGLVVPNYVSVDHLVTKLQASDNILQGLKQLETDSDGSIYMSIDSEIGIKNKNYSEIFRLKNVTAAWLVSHCETASKREDFIKVMQKTIDIDVSGKCNGRLCGDACERNIITQTKFYLSFENSLCVDYITEKVFNWFETDVIVVVRGARTYSRLLPIGTYVDADEFENAHELASFLKELGSNESKYTDYLKRKDRYKVIPGKELTQVAYCNLCRKLNDLKTYGRLFDMTKDWTGDACISTNDIDI